jgi:hypothetical protein
MVVTTFHANTHRSTITNGVLRNEISQILPDDWDVVEQRELNTVGIWPFIKKEKRTTYRLYHYIGVGFGDWQVITCVSNEASLWSFLAGYSAGHQGNR